MVMLWWRLAALRKPPLRAIDCIVMARGSSIVRGVIELVRASLVRALLAPAALAAALTLAGCYGEDGYQIPTRAMKELSPEMLTQLQQKNMPKDSPILVRVFKEESELEVWKEDTTGRYELLRVYPICRWSGDLGPKVKEGDRQAPEGFYAITPGLMNPNSSYYLAINIGFPNAFDKANGYTGNFLMIHGDCSSRGCYAMTDEQIGEIYSLARESFLGGQKEFQIQAYPFRMTPANLARHRNSPNMAFWKMLKVGDDHFLVSHREPKVDVCEKHYVFDAQLPENSAKPLTFTPTGRCPVYQTDAQIADAANEKQRNDDYQLAQLVSRDVPTAPLSNDTDGGMNRVFAAKLENPTYTYDDAGHLHVPPLQPGRLPPQISSGPSAVATSASSGGDSSAGGFFGSLFGSKASAAPSQVASTDSAAQSHGGLFGNLFSPSHNATADASASDNQSDSQQPTTVAAPARPKAIARNEPAARPKPNADTHKGESDEADASKTAPAPAPATAPAPQKQANIAAPPSSNSGMLKGAQPVVPTGSFDTRWGGFQ
jgi:murein L,D-transpeptidase YafK